MQSYRVLFFGSTTDSVIVLSTLSSLPSTLPLQVVAVVTQPPRPVGRKQILTPTPVELWAKEHTIPVLSFPSDEKKSWLYASQQTVVDALSPWKADLLISASYGQKIPTETITKAAYGGLNVHPSLLPHWRGADPVPWAIMEGEHQTGVTVVTLSKQFDEGMIIAQKKLPIEATHTSDPLRTTLFIMGAQLLADSIKGYINGGLKGKPQNSALHSRSVKLQYAKKLTRADGFEPWKTIQKAMDGGEGADRIERKFRALHPWPGLWTFISNPTNVTNRTNEQKRLKILSCHLEPCPAGRQAETCNLILDTVQLEGKHPASYAQFQQAYNPAAPSASDEAT